MKQKLSILHPQYPSAGTNDEFRYDYQCKIARKELKKTEQEYICIYKLHLFGDDAKNLVSTFRLATEIKSDLRFTALKVSFYNDSSIKNPTRGSGRAMPLNDSIDLCDFVEKRALFANHLSCCSLLVCSKSARKQDGISTECFP